MTRPFLLLLLAVISVGSFAQPLTLDAIKNYPFPTELTAAQQGSRIAWALDELGRRNIYVAEGPDFKPRKLTNYADDDGQEISSLAISANGQWVVFVRGGDHGSNWDPELAVNPAFSTTPSKVKVMVIPFAGGEVKSVSEGDAPAISPKSDVVAFVKGGQVWTAPLDGSTEPRNLFTARGSQHSLTWSPDGSRLAFVSARGDHSFIGIYSTAEQPITWISSYLFVLVPFVGLIKIQNALHPNRLFRCRLCWSIYLQLTLNQIDLPIAHLSSPTFHQLI
jgi:dipeptidyl aminopeptidase/acylaminoacyl peptidase